MPRRQYLDELLDSLVQLQQREFQLGSDHIKRERSQTLLVVLGILSLGLLVSAALALGLVRHLTALYRREEAAIQQAERAAAAREELLATVAHDLRSPLGAIRLRAASLCRGIGDEQVKRQAVAIERVVARMDHLVRSLLDQTTIEAGRFTLDRDGGGADAHPRSRGPVWRHRRLQFGAARASPKWQPRLLVHGDKERIIRVLSNLAVNAIKFTPPRGAVERGAEPDAAGVRFWVHDSVPGIPPEQLTRVFERPQDPVCPRESGTGSARR